MAVECDLAFASDLTGFTSELDVDGQLTWHGTASASPDGTTGCAKVVIDDTDAAAGLFDRGPAIGATPTDMQCASYWDFGDLAISADAGSVMIWSLRTASTAISSVSIVRTSGSLYLSHAIIADSAGPTGGTVDVLMTGNVPLRLALWVKKATNGTGADDGFSKLYGRGGDYVDAWTLISEITGVDIFDNFANCETIRTGATNVAATVSCTELLFDRIQWNTDTDLLVFNATPTVSDPGTLYAGHEAYPVGTAVTVADTDSNLEFIQYTCESGKGTWNGTLGSSTVSAGALASNTVTITGTNAALLATHATMTLTPASSAASIVTNACTITATDDVTASAARNFNVVQSYGVIRGTLAQVNATLVGILTVENATEQSCTMGVTATDSDSNEGYAECALTFGVAIGGGNVGLRSGISAILAKQRTRDRRRGLVRMRP